MTLQRRVEGVDLGRSLGRQLVRRIRRSLRCGDRSSPVDRTARTLYDRNTLKRNRGVGRLCRCHRTLNGSGGGRSATNGLGLGGAGAGRARGRTRNLAALVLVRQRRGVGVRNDVQNAVAVFVHEPVASIRIQLAADVVDGAVRAALARHDVLEEPELRRRTRRDRATEAARETRNQIRTADGVQRHSVAARRLPAADLAVIVQAIAPQLGVGSLVDAGVDLGVIVVAVAALEAGGEDTRGRANRELVAVHVGARGHLRERVHGDQRGHEGQQQGKLLHERTPWAVTQVIGNTTVPSGCRAWETYPLLYLRHPEGLTHGFGVVLLKNSSTTSSNKLMIYLN